MAANVNNYISAGNAAIRSALQARKALAENAPRYDQQAMEAVNQAATTNANIAKNNARAAQTKMAIEAGMERQRLGAKTKEYVQGQYKTARMTGLLAGGATLLGVGAMQMNKEEEENELLGKYKAMLDAKTGQINRLDQQISEGEAALSIMPDGTAKYTGGGKGDGDSAGKVDGGDSSTSRSSDLFDMSSLTNKDYDDLAFAISSEAELGTDDEFGVAANILTRLKSGNYGNSISSIIHAPGQYEGVYTGRSVASPEIAARLQTPEGQQKIQEFIKRLNGRTEFKGQSMLHNRVPSEDPMFSPGGNFYHYPGQ